MTAASTPVQSRPPLAGRVAPLTLARLLRLELRRNAMPWILPVIAALFWFDCYRVSTTLPPLWSLRTFYILGQGHSLIDFGPFVAGVAAWMGSRDGRRGVRDLVTATVQPRWAAQLASWAATACWAVGSYLVFMGVLFAVIARQVAWGGPPWWSVAVGAAGVAAFSALGFAAGVYLPSRFAAPLAAFGAFLAMGMSSQTGFRYSSGLALILPTNSNGNFGNDAGIFYPYLPDLPIARVMFLAGVAVAAAGLLGLPASAGGRRLRWSAAVVTVAGMAAAGTALGLAATARVGPYGAVIPALHDAANDRPISYTPVCSHAGVLVCVQPAYRPYLREVTSAVGPVFRELAGLPGAPVRAAEVATTFTTADQVATIGGSPPVLRLPLNAIGLPGAFGADNAGFSDQLRLQFLYAFVSSGTAPGRLAQQAAQLAQQAVVLVLLRGAGVPFRAQPSVLVVDGRPAPEAVFAAARRLAALPAAARHAWLAAHIGALRAGQITLGQLP
jgi:hypothetical protein